MMIGTCPRCDGEGEILICPDDMCRGIGECIHGDGYIICPGCDGEGAVEYDDVEDLEESR